MKLKFHSRRDHKVAWPGANNFGQPPRYIGRSFVIGDGKTEAAVHPANKEPDVVDTETTESRDVQHIVRQCSKGGLFPADRETAAACGVEFVSVTLDSDGEWVVGSAPKRSSAAADKPKASES